MAFLPIYSKMPIGALVILITSLFWIASSGPSSQVRIYPKNFTNLNYTELRWPLGQPLQLTCELILADDVVLVSQKPRLEWYLPHSRPEGRQINHTEEYGRSILYINNVSKADSGHYNCSSHFGSEARSAVLKLYVKTSTSDFPQCNSAGLFQCQDNKHICIANRYVCDGVKDCNDGSDETPEQCGPGDWCSGRIRCGNEQRCMDPRFCCDPQDDINCAYVMECCKVYIDLKRNLHRQYGIEKSGQNTNNTKHHLFVIVGCIAAFTCILLVVIILMCQFPAEKPCLRPPNFLTRGLGGQSSRHHGHSGHRRRSNFQPRVPVTMEDLDVYFESLRNVSSNSHSVEDHHIRMPLHPPPYSLNFDPPPPYPGPGDHPVVGAAAAIVVNHHHQHEPENAEVENNNEDNNNGDINGNSDLRDQHSERVVAVLRLSPPLQRRTNNMRGGSSLVALNHQPRSQQQQQLQQINHQQPLRGSRSVATLVSVSFNPPPPPPLASVSSGQRSNNAIVATASARGLVRQYPASSSDSSSSFTD